MTRTLPELVQWEHRRQSFDIRELITSELGVEPITVNGACLWVCPFHADRNPSLKVTSSHPYRFKCWSCDAQGDAVEFLMRLRLWSFKEAALYVLGESQGEWTTWNRPTPHRAPEKPVERFTGIDPLTVGTVVAEAERGLWAFPGAYPAREDLQGRKISRETAMSHRLGWVDGLEVPRAGGGGTFKASGLLIPWFGGGGQVVGLVVRAYGQQSGPKYARAFTDRHGPGLYPSGRAVKPSRPLIILEGELDVLSVLTASEGLEIGVGTIGGASVRPSTLVTDLASEVISGHDDDGPGDRGAAMWPEARRLLPPGGHKDWSDAARAGEDVRGYLTASLNLETVREEPSGNESQGGSVDPHGGPLPWWLGRLPELPARLIGLARLPDLKWRVHADHVEIIRPHLKPETERLVYEFGPELGYWLDARADASESGLDWLFLTAVRLEDQEEREAIQAESEPEVDARLLRHREDLERMVEIRPGTFVTPELEELAAMFDKEP